MNQEASNQVTEKNVGNPNKETPNTDIDVGLTPEQELDTRDLETKLRQDLGMLEWQIRDLLPIIATHYKAREAEIELRAEAKALQWVEDLGIEATESCSVHDMNEYHQKFGEGVSFKVHTRLLDEVLPKLELLSKESSS